METIDDLFQLNFTTTNGFKVIVNKDLISDLNKYDYSKLPKDTKVIIKQTSIYDIYFTDKTNFKILSIPVECRLSISKKEYSLYSFQHLKLILDKYKKEYKNPYYYSTYYLKDIYINDTAIENKYFSFEEKIEIKEKDNEDNKKKIKKIFEDLTKIYKKDCVIFSYEYISPNYDIYFPKNFHGNLSDKFDYIYSNYRRTLESNFSKFINDKKELIYPICGPHNIGKTITALIIQKEYYQENKKSLYLNLKYYFYEPLKDLEQKIETLIKECFYFIENEKELLNLYDNLKKINKIDDMLSILKKYLFEKKYDTKDFFLIIDQYQKKLDSNDILIKFSNFKIFLLSSINDSDVKDNLILTYQEKYQTIKKKEKFLKYTYYEHLFDFNDYIITSLENQIKDKIKTTYIGIKENKILEKL